MGDDTISRKATIDAMEGVDWYHINKDGQLTHGANSKEDEPLYKAKDVYAVLNKLPSAQPEKRTEERTETHSCDCISRQAAIDALTRKMVSIPTAGEKDLMGDANRIRAEDISVIRRLPSAQPEIIRCEDCKHWNRESICDGFCSEDCMRHDEGFYCGNAERRTDERQT